MMLSPDESNRLRALVNKYGLEAVIAEARELDGKPMADPGRKFLKRAAILRGVWLAVTRERRRTDASVLRACQRLGRRGIQISVLGRRIDLMTGNKIRGYYNDAMALSKIDPETKAYMDLKLEAFGLVKKTGDLVDK